MYNAFSNDYDRFVNWPARLAGEIPFIEQQLQAIPGRNSLLDAACGTGMHAIALAQRGYRVAGADLSAGMIEKARSNAAAAGVDVNFKIAGFGELAHTFPDAGSFDTILCLGNSLPHMLTPEGLVSALSDFAACLRTGGLMIIQNRNFDAILAHHERWMEPQFHREGEGEWLFLRFYDFEADGLLNFNILTLLRHARGDWSQQVVSTRLRPLLQEELTSAVRVAGFVGIACYGGMASTSFEPQASNNLVMTARKVKK
jgi:glycine/sarcosine N-methyltransferase